MAKAAEIKLINHLHPTEHRWFAVHTRFKCEKFVVDLLDRKNIKAYVPLRTSLRMYGARKRKTTLPVISCYAFVQIIEPEYRHVLETEHVLTFVRASKNLMAIPEVEMNNLRRIAMDENLEYTATPERYTEGQAVTISSGNLAGMQGIIVKIDGKDKFVVELETIGHSILIEMDSKYLN
jgi:transcriptional antiterminator RfaH